MDFEINPENQEKDLVMDTLEKLKNLQPNPLFDERKRLYDDFMFAEEEYEKWKPSPSQGPKYFKKMNEAAVALRRNTQDIQLQGILTSDVPAKETNDFLRRFDFGLRNERKSMQRAQQQLSYGEYKKIKEKERKVSELPPEEQGIEAYVRDFEDTWVKFKTFGITPATMTELLSGPVSRGIERQVSSLLSIPYMLAGKVNAEDIPKIHAGEMSITKAVSDEYKRKRQERIGRETATTDESRLGMVNSEIPKDKFTIYTRGETAKRTKEINAEQISAWSEMMYGAEAMPAEVISMFASFYGSPLYVGTKAIRSISKLPISLAEKNKLFEKIVPSGTKAQFAKSLPRYSDWEKFFNSKGILAENLTQANKRALIEGYIPRIRSKIQSMAKQYADDIGRDIAESKKVDKYLSKAFDNTFSHMNLSAVPGIYEDIEKIPKQYRDVLNLEFKQQYLLNKIHRMKGRLTNFDDVMWRELNRVRNELDNLDVVFMQKGEGRISEYAAEIISKVKRAPNIHTVKAQKDLFDIARTAAQATGLRADSPEIMSIFKPLTVKEIKSLKSEIYPAVQLSKYTAKDLGIEHFIPTTGVKDPFAAMWDNKMAEPLRKFVDKVEGPARELFYGLASPETVASKDPAALKIFKLAMSFDGKGTAQWQSWLQDFNKVSTIKRGSKEAKILGNLLDKYATLDDIPVDSRKWLKEVGEHNFTFYKDRMNQLAALQNAKNPLKLRPNERLQKYIHRSYDMETVYNSLKSEKNYILSMQEMGVTTNRDIKNLDKINKLIKRLESPETREVPNYISAFVGQHQFKKRVLPELITEIDSGDAYVNYISHVKRYMFDEPVIQYGIRNLGKIKDPYVKDYMKYFLKRYYGLEKRTGLKDFTTVISGLEHLQGIGWNFRTALVNATQNINTISEIGVDYTLRGGAHGISKSMLTERAWAASKYKPAYDEYVRYISGGLDKRIWSDTIGSSMALMQKVELANRKIAFNGAFIKAMEMGDDIPTVKDLLRRGFTKFESAVSYADDVMAKTQFIYGRTGISRAMHSTLGRPLMVFTTFPVKQLELFNKWATQNPDKLMAYVAISNATRGQVNEVGFDMSNALGLGIEPDLLFDAMRKLGAGDIDMAKVKGYAAIDPMVTGGGVLPTNLLPGLSQMENVWNDLTSKTPWNAIVPVQGKRLIQAWRGFSKPTESVRVEYQKMPDGTVKQVEVELNGFELRKGTLSDTEAEYYTVLKGWEMLGRTFGPTTLHEKHMFTQEAKNKVMSKIEQNISKSITNDLARIALHPKAEDKNEIIGRLKNRMVRLARLGLEYKPSTSDERIDKLFTARDLRNLEDKQRIIRQQMSEGNVGANIHLEELIMDMTMKRYQ